MVACLIHFGLWLSLVERLVRDQEAVGSNPTSPIRLPMANSVLLLRIAQPENRTALRRLLRKFD